MTRAYHWPHVEIGDLVRIGSGQVSPLDSDYSELPHIGPENLRVGGGIVNSGVRTARDLGLVSGKYVFDETSILYSKIRPALNKVGLPEFSGICSADMYPMWVRDPKTTDREFVYHALTSEAFVDSAAGRSFRTGIPKINREDLESLTIPVPPLPEQRKIAEILRTWDDAVDKTLELRRLLDARRVELAERILVPSHGVRRKMSELTRPIKSRNSAASLGRESVMGVSNRAGLVPMREQTIAADISRYQVLPPKAFAYNPMRINVGSIAMSRLESDVLVSPDYVLFQCDERELRPDYLDHVLRTRWWLHHVNAGASGSVRTRTYYDDLAAISIAAPPVAGQDNVSSALDGLGREIQLLQHRAELLRTQKRGLMQKLLTGQVRVNVAAETEPGGRNDD